MSVTAIEVSQLSKTYKNGIQAVKDISFSVEKGEFFTFIGPNGAGKSTTIKMLTTLMRPTSGRCTIHQYDLLTQASKIRAHIGVALQTSAIDPFLTGREMLVLQGRLFGFSKHSALERATELLDLVGLQKDADRKCGKYSGGMQRRLDLALTLVHRPEILFLDEPTTGLDPESRTDLWNEIVKLNKEFKTTIFLTTQYLEEADKLSDQVCIIKEGSIVALQKPEALKRSIAMQRIRILFASEKESTMAKSALQSMFEWVEIDKAQAEVFTEDSKSVFPEMLKRLSQEGIFPVHIETASPNLDDVFLHFVNRKKESPTMIKEALSI